MSRSLPPLNALRAFEAAARHLSFTRAADELHVTQAAISHQVKGLEERLGMPLFRRVGRTLVLTDAAQHYLQDVRDAFDSLAEATRRLRTFDATGALNISALPSFAARWLLPRLGRFQAAHPEIDLRISTTQALVDFAREDVDLAIRFGHGRYPGLRADFLKEDSFFPVCSPALLKGPHPLKTPADLKHHTLLHDEPRDLWRQWLLIAGVEGVDPNRGPGFTDSGMVVQAAIEGQGVAIARAALAETELKSGRLVRPFKESFPSQASYWLVCPEATADRPKIVAFRDWILAEAARERGT